MPDPAIALSAADCAAASGATLQNAVCTATGPIGLLIIGIYSFLIAIVLPLPSEIVLAPAGAFRLGVPTAVTLALIVLVSGLAKTAGSLVAFKIGHGVKDSGPVVSALRKSPIDVVEWSEKRTVELAQNYGYVGLAVALSVPGFPDTLSIYAFSVLEEDHVRFAVATFVGSVGRLLVTLALVGGAFLAA